MVSPIYTQNPGEIQGEKTICCLCCASGPVGANLRVERKGFVPGENIFISGDVINNSSRRMKSVKIVIAQVPLKPKFSQLM